MNVEIDTFQLYFVKGMAGVALTSLLVDVGSGIRFDRRIALAKDSERDSRWGPKSEFFVSKTHPVLAGIAPKVADFNKLSHESHLEVEEALGEKVTPIYTGDSYSMTDGNNDWVSFLNLNTVEAVGRHMGVQNLDPRKFHMNVWLRMPAFSELDLLSEPNENGPIITINKVKMQIQSLCVRCAAVNADLETGKRDNPPGTFVGIKNCLKERGYAGFPDHNGKLVHHIMGFFAKPLNSGIIHIDNRCHIDV